MPKFYDASSIRSLSWSSYANGALAASLFAPLLTQGASRYVANVHEDLELAEVGNRLVPLVINHGDTTACALSSIQAHYVHYARDFLRTSVGPLVALPLRALLALLQTCLRAGRVNRTVFINNWLLPTSPRPTFSAMELNALASALEQRFPDYALVLKGCCDTRDARVIGCARRLGFRSVLHRRVYLLDPQTPGLMRKRNVRRAFSLLHGTRHYHRQRTQFVDATAMRLRGLYRGLYLHRHSSHNPDLTPRWFRELLGGAALETITIEGKDQIDAFVCLIDADDELVASVGGYDTHETGRRKRLYEQMVARLLATAVDRRKPLNLSSGAGRFKALRGGVATEENDLVRWRHLPALRRVAWRALAGLYNGLGRRVYAAVEQSH